MTKKDYIAIAGIVKKLRKMADENNNPVWAIKIISTLTAELTDFCELDNPRFDRKTFIDATQLEEVKNGLDR
tara:strand:+ start:110 stop:325 length:216 start_codon:yes stop_codon:yes gene_type:complete